MFFLKELPTQKMLERYADKYPDMDVEKTADALSMMRKASVMIRELEAYFVSNNLSLTRFLILIVLDREPGAQFFTMQDIVKRLDVSKPVITNTLKTLEQSELIKIAGSKTDKRAKNISITEAGRKKLSDALPGYYQLINQQMERNDEI